ncbi:MAG: aldo/keto reductase, partial [Atopobiaceae bacterium]|nr:aldo/keto reductase [Atopobiaceae bacterium]
MNTVTLGSTGITVAQNAFGALPIQRTAIDEAVRILRRAYEGGMRYFDTARAYSDSEEKLGLAFGDGWLRREDVYLATKTQAKTPEKFWDDLDTSLEKLRTSYIDVYQFHMAAQVWRPGDGSGMYEAMQEAKAAGKIRHISITAHKIGVAEEAARSG